jgi:hypothetical protein
MRNFKGIFEGKEKFSFKENSFKEDRMVKLNMGRRIVTKGYRQFPGYVI